MKGSFMRVYMIMNEIRENEIELGYRLYMPIELLIF